MARLLIILGILLILIGILWPFLKKIGLGHLPGDIVIQKENFTFYFPIMTGILLSVVITLILWLISRF